MMRIYEIARKLNLPNKELLAAIRGFGIEVNNHMSSLSDELSAHVLAVLKPGPGLPYGRGSTVLKRDSRPYGCFGGYSD